jgi:8-oxo-dGTP pyrophosphatase MutT (NUDIX family)
MERSSGGVIRYQDMFLLLHYGLGHWGFVKGHLEIGETPMDAFLREAQEEAGFAPTDLSIIPGFEEKIHYFFKKGTQTICKEVHYFLADSSKMMITLSSEHTAYQWLTYQEALETLTFPEDQGILEKAYAFLRSAKPEKPGDYT